MGLKPASTVDTICCKNHHFIHGRCRLCTLLREQQLLVLPCGHWIMPLRPPTCHLPLHHLPRNQAKLQQQYAANQQEMQRLERVTSHLEEALAGIRSRQAAQEARGAQEAQVLADLQAKDKEYARRLKKGLRHLEQLNLTPDVSPRGEPCRVMCLAAASAACHAFLSVSEWLGCGCVPVPAN
jgi:hypothetical protein